MEPSCRRGMCHSGTAGARDSRRHRAGPSPCRRHASTVIPARRHRRTRWRSRIPQRSRTPKAFRPGNQNQRDAADEARRLVQPDSQSGFSEACSDRNGIFSSSIELRRRTERHDATTFPGSTVCRCAGPRGLADHACAGWDDTGRCPNGMAGAAATDDVRHDSPET
jgi:hypothetical protein